MRLRIYNFEKRFDNLLKLIQQDKEISEDNFSLIIKFKDNCFSEGVGLPRIIRYLQSLRYISKWLKKSFENATKNDIKGLVADIQRMSKYSEATKYEFKVTIKRFYKWLRDSDHPEEVEWLKLTFRKSKQKLPEDLPMEEDIKKMIDKSYSKRDKAIFSALWETGCRIEEFLTIRMKDVEFDDYGAKLCVSGKTGTRKIRVITSAPYLTEYLSEHPLRDDPNAPVWIKSQNNKMMTYSSFRKLLSDIAKRANVKKRVNPHNFRHARATYLANFLTEQQLKNFMGWTQASKMAAIYVHLNGKDIDNALLKMHNIENKEETVKKDILKTEKIKCVRCNEDNISPNKFCYKCGMILDKYEADKLIQEETKRNQADVLMNELVKDKEVLNILLTKIKEKNLN